MRCGLKTTRRYPQLGPRMCDEASRDPTGGHDVAFIIIIDIASGGPRCFCGYMWSTYNIADKSVFGVQYTAYRGTGWIGGRESKGGV